MCALPAGCTIYLKDQMYNLFFSPKWKPALVKRGWGMLKAAIRTLYAHMHAQQIYARRRLLLLHH